MRNSRWLAPLMVATCVSLSAAQGPTRELTFEDRVAAQRAIEQVYYRHQIDARLPFDEAVPREVLERKVRDSLRLSALLEHRWKEPITAPMLRAELQRMALSTRMPERLVEIYAALGDDPILIQECLVRPALAGRLARARFSADGESPTAARGGSWDEWWRGAGPVYDLAPVRTVALASETVPQPLAAACRLGDTWSTDGGLKPHTDRRNHTAVWTGSRMIVWGGSNDSGQLNTGVQYDPVTDTSTPTSTTGVFSAAGHTAVWTGSRMIVWGGQSRVGASYDPIANTWSSISSASAPAGYNGHTAVWTGTHMIVWGGWNGTTTANTGSRYNPQTNQWTPMTPLQPPPGRYLHTAVWTGTQMIVWGGYNSTTGPLNSGGRYDPVADQWSPTNPSNAPAARHYHAAVWTGSRMIVWGGFNGMLTYFDSGALYDPTLDAWTPTPLAGAPAGRYRHTAVWTGDRMVISGGDVGGQNIAGPGGQFDPVTNAWSTVTTTGSPGGRHDHTAVWTGNRMIVWGGVTEGRLYGQYAPAADIWTSSFPIPRLVTDKAVWTGSLMIVGEGVASPAGSLPPLERYDPALDLWTPAARLHAPSATGGPGSGPPIWTGQIVIVSGGRYDPAADTWSSVSSVNAPPAGSAVWTGSAMLLWGGGAGNVGGRYDPLADTWAPISMAGAPPAGYSYTVVWSGSLMLAWGASGTSSILNAGGRYDPFTDTWSPMSLTNTPIPRRSYKSVWAGGRMVVYGGFYGNSYPRTYPTTGGSYDPAADAWSTFDYPTVPGRELMAAVSTGHEAVFWGGIICTEPDPSVCGESADLQDGFRYDPQSGQLSQLSTIGAPSWRSKSAGVWTGQEMIVWSGVGELFRPLHDGGSYAIGLPPGADADGDGFDASCDCDDTDASVHPLATRICGDGLNNNCSDPFWPLLSDESDDDGDGLTECQGDCDDLASETYPGAPEVNDGRDNQCPADAGYRLTDELSGIIEFPDAGDTGRICWPAQQGADTYRLGRATSASMGSGLYCAPQVATPCDDDDTIPPPGTAFFYLVHVESPFAGSWGSGTSGVETVVSCGGV